MKMPKQLFVLFFAVPLVFLTNCDLTGDEEAEVDFKEESEGMYTYTMTLTLIANPGVTDTQTGTLEVHNNSGDIWFTLDPGVDSRGVFTQNLTMAGNGYVFDIDTFVDTDDDGDYFECIGMDCASLDGINYHGRYDTDEKVIYLSMKADYSLDMYDPYNYMIDMTATKIEE